VKTAQLSAHGAVWRKHVVARANDGHGHLCLALPVGEAPILPFGNVDQDG